jgi:hypothetical protein
MKAYGGENVQIHVFLTSAVVGVEWSASRPYRLNKGLDGPQTDLNDMRK